MEWGLDSCLKAFEERRLRSWIEEYLQCPQWSNEDVLQRVRDYSVYWGAPVLVPISDFRKVTSEQTETVNEIVQSRPNLEDLPPLIAWRDPDGSIVLADGVQRLAAIQRLGFTNAWVLLHNEALRSIEELQEEPSSVIVTREVGQDYSAIAERFQVFAKECEGSSDLYHYLSLRIAEDEDLLAISLMSRHGQPEPNMLFGVVHLLLTNGLESPLRRYYPSLVLNFESAEIAFPIFRKFVLDHVEKIVPLLQEKLVQTNEVQRSAYIFPAILTAAQYFEGQTITLIEIGASAGFNLRWDQYQYQYDEDDPIGLPNSSLTVASTFRGNNRPNFDLPSPTIVDRIGIDLNPIDVMSQEQITWLQALVWPEHFDRKARLSKALRIALVNPINMIQGDAITSLPGILTEVPQANIPLVYHTWVANQMSGEQREQLLLIIDEFGQKRDIVHIHTNIEPHLHATIYRSGERIDIALGNTDPHARWIEWLA